MTNGHDYTICRHFSIDRTCDLLLFFFPDFGGSTTTATELEKREEMDEGSIKPSVPMVIHFIPKLLPTSFVLF